MDPIPMLLACPACHERHIDEGEFAEKPHHTHACQHCGMVWRPAIVPTVGVRFLPGFKNTPGFLPVFTLEDRISSLESWREDEQDRRREEQG